MIVDGKYVTHGIDKARYVDRSLTAPRALIAIFGITGYLSGAYPLDVFGSSITDGV